MRFSTCLFALVMAPLAYTQETKPTAEQLEFFEAKVRPMLIDHCLQCHGEKKQSGGLRLDSRKAILEGGDNGPAAIAGDAAKSPMVKALLYKDDNKMPPKGKLDDAKIEILAAWVKMGLPFPSKAETVSKAVAESSNKNHWSYQPLAKPAGDSIDEFIAAKLKASNLKPNPEANRHVLIRRLYFDLLGLPPTPEEIEAFCNDPDPKAYEKLIDKLLANPHYGERWARYWLDYARYADTKGYLAGGVDRNYPYAYTYRDWVVKALNEDMPYDRFIKLQIAADRYTSPDHPADYAAMGFLTVGRRFLGDDNDLIDDRIDVVCRTFLGLTVTCARCHDHKFDPIPTKDYYSLAAVFRSSVEPAELPLIAIPKKTPELESFEKELKIREEAVEEYIVKRRGEIAQKLRDPETLATYLLFERMNRKQQMDALQGLFREKDIFQLVYTRYKQVVNNAKNASVFRTWNQLGELPAVAFAQKAEELIAAESKKKGAEGVAAPILEALQKGKPKSLADAAQIMAKVLAVAAGAEKPTADQVTLAKLVTGENGLANYQPEELQRMFNVKDKNKVNALKAKVDEWKFKSPYAPARAMVLVDAKNPSEGRVLIRGNPRNQGAVVPRQFLEILCKDRKPFKDGSGRKELAEAIASKDNPLTARVMVNRMWQLHFGQGIVRTPSDFGIRCDPPTHPELLDFLAGKFMEDGWSIKKMHKRILMSNTYRQTSDATIEQVKADAENRLWSRQNRRRLDFESLRDSLLATSGKIDLTVGGKPIDLFKEPFTGRRTIYGHIDRQNLPGTFRAFDFAGPDQHSPQRFQTTVPQQALYLMNSPFLAQQAKGLVERSEVARESDPKRKIEELVRLVWGRTATPKETDLALHYIQTVTTDKPQLADEPANDWEYGYGWVLETGFTSQFKKLPHWNGQAWQGGATLPDAKLGWVFLDEKGGHPGDNPGHVAIRRWTAPADMEIDIVGKLIHANIQGDGVRGAIVSSRVGIMLEKSAYNKSVDMIVRSYKVKKGETIDFAVDCLKDTNSDGFTWAPILRQLGNTGRTWDAPRDFRGPQPAATAFTNWDQLAQILLLSNEFSFVD